MSKSKAQMPNKAPNPNFQFQNLGDYNLGFDIGIWSFIWYWDFDIWH
jgi:hypothetical protein